MTVRYLLRFVGILVLLGICGKASLVAAQTNDDQSLPPAKTLEEILQLSGNQKGLRVFNRAVGHKALAISEEGIWSMTSDMNSTEWAAWRALTTCGRRLSGKMQSRPSRGCFIYRLDDQFFTEPTELSLEKFMAEMRKLPEYTIDLGESTRAAYKRHATLDPENKAFAVSPGGGWAYAFDYEHPDDAVTNAINRCDTLIDLSDAVCRLYALNGNVISN